MDALIDPFTPSYMQRAWLELALLVVPAAALGVFAVLRRLAFATHALGVGTFPGAVIAVSLGLSAFAGGLAAAVLMAGLLAGLQRRSDIDVPAGVGLLLAGALALGSLLVSDLLSVSARVDTLLFGSLLSVTEHDVVRSAAVGAVVLVALGVLGRGWLFVAFDRESARAFGLRSDRLDLALFVLLAVAVVASVDAVGGLLVSTLFVVPAATAGLFVRRPLPLVGVSAALALLIATGGLVVSFHTNAPPGATIAALAAGVFGVAVAFREAAERLRPRAAIVVAALALVAVAAGCGGSGGGEGAETSASLVPAATDASNGALAVVVTTPQVADWARRVGGNRVEVVQLLAPNVDPHEYEPTPDDAEAIAGADIVFSSGAGFDEFADELVESAGGDVPFVELAPEPDLKPPALESEPGHEEEAGHDRGDVDPHFWHDPTLAAKAVQALEQALARAAPEAAEEFAENAVAYVSELEALDTELEGEFDAVPARSRKMVTDHDAFGYLARRYGIEIVGSVIPSASTAAEPNAKDTAELIKTIEAQGVCSIFSESSVDPKLIEQVAAETDAEVVPDLYGDTLGPEGSGAATYVEMMRHNARVLVEGFIC